MSCSLEKRPEKVFETLHRASKVAWQVKLSPARPAAQNASSSLLMHLGKQHKMAEVFHGRPGRNFGLLALAGPA